MHNAAGKSVDSRLRGNDARTLAPIRNPKSKIRNLLVVFICGSLLFTPKVSAQTQQPLTLLVDDNLQYQSVGLESITESAIGFFDSNWSYQQLSRQRVLQLRNIEARHIEPVIPSQRLALLTLTDGQQFVGRMQQLPEGATQTDSSLITWQSPILGPLKISLDRVKSIYLAPIDFRDGQQTDDRIQLANGDQLKGFLLGVTDQEIELEIGDQATVAKLPLDQVHAIRLANPVTTPDKPQHRLYLVDGTVLLCDDVLLSHQMLTVTGSHWHQITRLPMREVARIDLASRTQQLTALGSQPHKLLAGAQAFGVDFPPTVNVSAVSMQAPTTLQFDLPSDVSRFAADAVIDWRSTDPPRARNWTDFSLTVKLDDKVVLELAFNSKSPQHRINLPISHDSKQITFQVTPGLNGPVMDRVKLVEPVLLIER